MDESTACLYPTCDRESVGVYGIKLCQAHLFKTMQGAMRLIEDGGQTEYGADSQALDRLRRAHRRNRRWGEVATKLQGDAAPSREWVYFLAFADRVKIGYTTNLGMRLEAIPYDEVLAVIPGTREDERLLHERFHHLRIVREWFQSDPELLAHIEALKAAHPGPAPQELLPRRRRSRRPPVTVTRIAAS